MGKFLKSDSADMCAGKFPLVSIRGRAEGLACADPGARTPIGASGIFWFCFLCYWLYSIQCARNLRCDIRDITGMTIGKFLVWLNTQFISCQFKGSSGYGSSPSHHPAALNKMNSLYKTLGNSHFGLLILKCLMVILQTCYRIKVLMQQLIDPKLL
jgi:hypothetical protein